MDNRHTFIGPLAVLRLPLDLAAAPYHRNRNLHWTMARYLQERDIRIYPYWCNVSPSPTDVSPTENSLMLHPLDKVSLGYFAPDRTIPSQNSNLIERSDTRLPTVACFSTAKRWRSMCGPSVHPTEGRQFNKPGQGHRWCRPDAPLIH
jgi:hypothetical protein